MCRVSRSYVKENIFYEYFAFQIFYNFKKIFFFKQTECIIYFFMYKRTYIHPYIVLLNIMYEIVF